MPELGNRSEPIKLYLDDDPEPFKVASVPLTFEFNTIALPDGPHSLRIEASNGLAPPTIREIPFVVRNGVALTVSGLEAEQTIAGQVQMVINAYAGNTEVDFEPRRAETPQPIPTWAWVVLLGVVAWTMYYLVNPQVNSSAAEAVAMRPTEHTGERIFADTCARCHGEDGKGHAPKVPPLRDASIALAETAATLLIKVTASDSGSMMPEWGTRLTNEELVAVVNHVRRSWGHDGSTIELRHRKPPEGIDDLHRSFSRALKQRDLSQLMLCCAATGEGALRPQIYRTDGVDQRGVEAVQRAWANYFDALVAANARVTQVSLPDARYDYDAATVGQDGSIVIGTGRIFLETKNDKGKSGTAKGRFIRIYQVYGGRWTLAFDFADIPMAVGCVPGTVICPEDDDETLPSSSSPTDPTPTPLPAGAASPIGYAEVQAMLRKLGKSARSAPHGSFWEGTYEDFVDFAFAEDWGEEGRIRVLVKGNSAESNLLRALRGEKGIVVHHPDGTTTIRDDLKRMPQGGPYLETADLEQLAAWIDAGCPEFAGAVGEMTPGAPAAPGEASPGRQAVPQDPFAPGPGGFPPPQPAPAEPEAPQAPGGFPPPQPAPGGGFPPPQPVPGGGFPPPQAPPEQPKER